jgi:hypothetical protein
VVELSQLKRIQSGQEQGRSLAVGPRERLLCQWVQDPATGRLTAAWRMELGFDNPEAGQQSASIP